jgi:hypothetical protein
MDTLTGKRMPMNDGAVPQRREGDVAYYAAGDAHWQSCPARAQFDRRVRRA